MPQSKDVNDNDAENLTVDHVTEGGNDVENVVISVTDRCTSK